MKTSLTQISIGQRIEAARLSPNSTDTSNVPLSVNPSPGDSTIQRADTSQMDKAGGDVNQQTQQGYRETADNKRKGPTQEASALQYENRQVNPEDQAPSPNDAKDLDKTPPPKSKGFKESLIDAQMSKMMQNNSGGDRGSVDRDFGHKSDDPNKHVKNQPASEPLKRNKMDPYDNSNVKVKDPGPFPITGYENKSTNIPMPKRAFNLPKMNTPRFK